MRADLQGYFHAVHCHSVQISQNTKYGGKYTWMLTSIFKINKQSFGPQALLKLYFEI